jgi:hypothetical protein
MKMEYAEARDDAILQHFILQVRRGVLVDRRRIVERLSGVERADVRNRLPASGAEPSDMVDFKTVGRAFALPSASVPGRLPPMYRSSSRSSSRSSDGALVVFVQPDGRYPGVCSSRDNPGGFGAAERNPESAFDGGRHRRLAGGGQPIFAVSKRR